MTVPRASCTWTIRAGSDETIATWDPPSSSARAGAPAACFICAHGAGGHMSDRLTLATTAALNARGIGTVRFNFFYRARGSPRPDLMPRLLACFEAVITQVREDLDPRTLILGGRSMGGRAASMLASERPVGDGLLLLAYPLHPPGQVTKLRDQHLAGITMPVLCMNGTRDAFCERPLMERVVAKLGPNFRMHWIEGADHSFHVLKSSGRRDADVLVELVDEASVWADGLS